MNVLKRGLYTKLKNAFVVAFGSFLFVVAIQMFILPAGIFVGGLTGILQLLVWAAESMLGIDISLGGLVFVANMPILWLAWNSIGKRFAILTIISVGLQSVFFEIVPIHIFSDDMLLNAVFGGALIGLGSGFILKIGASGGGMDVISQFMSIKFDGSVGKHSFSINVVVILLAGLVGGWEIALYTILTMYIASAIVDRVHTVHQNLTLYIVTKKQDNMIQEIWSNLYRGITILEGKGAYTKEPVSTLMMVVSSYELYEALEIINSVDEAAFTNVVRSERVQGNFIKKKPK